MLSSVKILEYLAFTIFQLTVLLLTYSVSRILSVTHTGLKADHKTSKVKSHN